MTTLTAAATFTPAEAVLFLDAHRVTLDSLMGNYEAHANELRSEALAHCYRIIEATDGYAAQRETVLRARASAHAKAPTLSKRDLAAFIVSALDVLDDTDRADYAAHAREFMNMSVPLARMVNDGLVQSVTSVGADYLRDGYVALVEYLTIPAGLHTMALTRVTREEA